MIPVLQDSFYDADVPPEQQRGNCLSAVVASLIEVPLNTVPNFVQNNVDHEGDPTWDWWNCMLDFVKESGFEMRYLRIENDDRSTFPPPSEGEFYAVSGISPRNSKIYHIVIYQDGKMVHDPHPSQAGLVEITDLYHWTIIKPGEGNE